MSHYQFVNDVSDLMINSVYITQDYILCTVALSNDIGNISAQLAYQQRFEKEGELTLSLLEDNGKRLYTVSFSINLLSGRPSALIGCLIGPSQTDDNNEETIKKLTKAMHGMRPKNLLFFILQTLLRGMGIKSLFAIAAKSHIYGRSSKKLDRIKFDYDKFWEELGGKLQDQTFISLPLQHEKRSYEEIRTNKRATYARRYAILDDIEKQILTGLRGNFPESTTDACLQGES